VLRGRRIRVLSMIRGHRSVSRKFVIDLSSACRRMIDVLAGITDDQLAGATRATTSRSPICSAM